MASSNLKFIKAIVMDVDGVLTNGMIYLDKHGDELKTFHALDGLGIVLAKQAGLKTAFISARESDALSIRAKELGVDRLYQNRLHKTEALDHFLQDFKLEAREVCYVGDDLIDISILKRVGFPVAVSNAVQEVKQYARYVTKKSGGQGAVREVIERILKAKGLWQKVLQRYE